MTIISPNVVTILLPFLLVNATNLISQPIFPGLMNADGTPHPVHRPNPVTGRTLNILDFGANPANSTHDDLLAIEAALQQAQYGDEIYFPDGTYNLNSPSKYDSKAHLVLKSGVNLRGQSRRNTILLSAYGDKTIDRILKIQGDDNIVVANFSITANFTGRYSKDVKINNPQAGGPKYCISIEDENTSPSFNITVDSVRCSNFRRMGVRVANSHDVVVKNSLFSDATDVAGGGAGYGVTFLGNKLYDNNSKWNLVESSEFIGPYIRHGVLIEYASHNNLVRNNYFNDNRLDAIDLHGEDEYLNEIAFNRVENVLTGAGVGVGNSGSTHDASGPYNYIHDNEMRNCREGVKVYLGSPYTRIENNTVTGSTVPRGKGIYILNGPNTTVKGNVIYDNSGYDFTGIYLKYDTGTEGKGKGVPRNVKILENEIFNNAYGIRIFDGEGIVLDGNNVHDNARSDVVISSGVIFHTLLKIAIEGQGQVELDPPGESYPAGTVVTVRAKRAANWQFSHWKGDLSGSDNPTTILMADTKSITAVFEKNQNSDEVNLAGLPVGKGSIVYIPPGGIYNRGDTVQVIAVPDSGWGFAQWGGELSGGANPMKLVLESDLYFSAFFEELPVYQLAIWSMGQGTVVLDPPGGSYYQGATVALLAVPDEGWEFSSWGGALSGTDNPANVTVSGNLGILATFSQSTGVEWRTLLPRITQLYQNYPNPFNPSTEIVYDLKQSEHVRISVYNLAGQIVNVLADNEEAAGQHRLVWHGTDFFGGKLPTGVYLLELKTEHFKKTIKMTLVE